jgi:hypothetical protein
MFRAFPYARYDAVVELGVYHARSARSRREGAETRAMASGSLAEWKQACPAANTYYGLLAFMHVGGRSWVRQRRKGGALCIAKDQEHVKCEHDGAISHTDLRARRQRTRARSPIRGLLRIGRWQRRWATCCRLPVRLFVLLACSSPGGTRCAGSGCRRPVYKCPILRWLVLALRLRATDFLREQQL